MGMVTIAVKNVDERLYRKVKALASLKGRTVGEEVNDALATWLSQKTRLDLLEKWDSLEEQTTANEEALRKARPGLLSQHPGEFAVVAHGRVAGVYKRKEEAYREASKSNSTQAIVADLSVEEPRLVELGSSLLEGVVR